MFESGSATSTAAADLAALAYKKRKEDFVSNLSGGSSTEITYVIAIAPVCLALALALILAPTTPLCLYLLACHPLSFLRLTLLPPH